MRLIALTILSLFALPFTTQQAIAHCQIPCGIYDDERQFDTLEEHARTIEKSMLKIEELSAETPTNYHTIARWTMNKEEHAQEVQDIVHAYFLTQRVKVAEANDKKAYADYVKHTTILHQLLVTAMKCKQTTDTANVEKLRDLIAAYKTHYFKDHGHSHK